MRSYYRAKFQLFLILSSILPPDFLDLTKNLCVRSHYYVDRTRFDRLVTTFKGQLVLSTRLDSFQTSSRTRNYPRIPLKCHNVISAEQHCLPQLPNQTAARSVSRSTRRRYDWYVSARYIPIMDPSTGHILDQLNARLVWCGSAVAASVSPPCR